MLPLQDAEQTAKWQRLPVTRPPDMMRLVAARSGPPDDGFNPHGISVNPYRNLMVTSDFIGPSTTLHAVPGNLDLRGSIRVWTLHNRKIVKTIHVPGAGGTLTRDAGFNLDFNVAFPGRPARPHGLAMK